LQTGTKHPILTDTRRPVPFVKPAICISRIIYVYFVILQNYILLACLPLLLYERIFNYIQFVAAYIVLLILKLKMIRIAKLHSNTNGNCHTVRSVHCVIESLLMLIATEMLFAIRFVSQRENHY
jgi:hypothetical protein